MTQIFEELGALVAEVAGAAVALGVIGGFVGVLVQNGSAILELFI